MAMREGILSNVDHAALDLFLNQVLDGVTSGTISQEEAVGGLAHVIAAIDIGERTQIAAWFANPVTFMTDGR